MRGAEAAHSAQVDAATSTYGGVMKAFAVRVLTNALAIWVATLVVPGIDIGARAGQGFANEFLTFAGIGLIFGVVNALIKPLVQLLSIPFYILTLGLFTFIVNAFMLQITSWLANPLTLTFHIDSFFWSAILGAIVVSLVSTIVSLMLPDRWEGKTPAVR